ncbi:hypothetical protein F5050DRAFT_169015 [Lentinula boryana]|uniref:Uncharacterized protein n=1 Tax=Lentinula boryana TaxID=40481 RepID=A0ABQ8QC53_9AGAR|nr:hypothetical protein F5050DRAFT_169015 [Lentinula boryana]
MLGVRHVIVLLPLPLAHTAFFNTKMADFLNSKLPYPVENLYLNKGAEDYNLCLSQLHTLRDISSLSHYKNHRPSLIFHFRTKTLQCRSNSAAAHY